MADIDISIRTRALWHGVSALVGAAGLLLTSVWLQQAASDRLAQVGSLMLFATGFALSVFAVWRLGVARNLRWDWRGLLALLLMILIGYPLVFAYTMLVVTALVGTVYSNR